jgi:hypothetical protein
VEVKLAPVRFDQAPKRPLVATPSRLEGSQLILTLRDRGHAGELFLTRLDGRRAPD